MPEDILTEEDIIRLINGTNNLRDKAIVALLFDSGIRAGELMALRLKDISLDAQPAHIRVDGKTGQRKIPIWFSVPYLVQYLNTQKHLHDEDHIWREAYLPDSDKLGKEIDYSGVRNMLSILKKKTGLRKRCNPHTFRHSRATFYANKLTEQQLKVFFGWTGDSRMAATYVHLSGRDIDNAILQANGMKPKDDDTKPKLSIRTCVKCHMENAVIATFCSRCGASLDVSIAMKQLEKDRDLEEMGTKKIVGEDVEKELLEEIKKRRTRK